MAGELATLQIINGLDTVFSQMLSRLDTIDQSMKKLTDESYERGNFMGWSYYKKGKRRIYEQTVTYTGSAQTINLDIEAMFQLDLIVQIWLDATGLVPDNTARDFSIRMYTNPASAAYAELDAQTVNTAYNRVSQGGVEYTYPPASRIQIAYANTTAAKICKVTAIITEL